ncbi:MAG: ABC-three component system middle component 2 [Bacteroidaceae bacterium]
MKIFNTEFEISMRILLLLNAFEEGLDLDRILYLDFFTTYSKNYELDGENINGDNDFRLNDLMLQPTLFEKSIKELVLDGFVNVLADKSGFIYKINSKGKTICLEMKSDYSEEYKINASLTYQNFKDKNIMYLKQFAKEKEAKE